jgi:hypothetical protein
VTAFAARPALSLYLMLVLLGLATYLGGTHGVGAIRLFYLVGCAGIGFAARRFGPAYHFEALVVLFAFSAFLRRVVDYACGFDPHGFMLSGPLLAALAPTTDLAAAVMSRRGQLAGRLGPYVLAMTCVGYAALGSILNGDYLQGVIEFGKSASVLVYGCWLLANADDPAQVMRQGARAFALVTPVVGLYGIMQFLDPLPADRYWMTSTGMNSIGLPEPEKIRVFSTLNSPASLGNFMVFALILVGFLGRIWELLICAIPGAIALLLSQVRSAWLALVVAVFYTLSFSRTRARAAALSISVLAVGTFAVVATPLGAVIATRLATISDNLSSDGSAAVRLGEAAFIFDHLDDYLLGSAAEWRRKASGGYNPEVAAGTEGLVIGSIISMGVVFGLLFITGVTWAALQSLFRVTQAAPAEFVAAGALVVGQLVTTPLSNPTGAEFGILFWSVIAVAGRTPARRLAGSGIAIAAPVTPSRAGPGSR